MLMSCLFIFFEAPSSASSRAVVATEPSAPLQSTPTAAQLASESAVADASVGDTTESVATSNAYIQRQLGKLPVKRAPTSAQSREGIPTQES